MKRLAVLAVVSLVAGCSPAPTASPDAGAADAGPDVTGLLLNAFPLSASVWPGGGTDVDVFFQSEAPGTWTLEVTDLSGPGTAQLDWPVLDPQHPRVHVRVELPDDVGDALEQRLTVRATRDGTTKTAEARFNVGRATAPGFAVYPRAQAARVASGQPIVYDVRVVSFGGFSGTVSLLHGDFDGLASGHLTPQEVVVAPGQPGLARAEVTVLPKVAAAGAGPWGVSGRVRVFSEPSALTAIDPPTARVVGLRLPQRLVVSAGETRNFVRDVVVSDEAGIDTPTFSLENAPAGVTLEPLGLRVAATVPPGVYPLTVVGRRASGAEARGPLRLVVPGAPDGGWTLVQGQTASHQADVTGLYASGPAPVQVVGSSARFTAADGGWVRLAEDGSFFSTSTRGATRVEGRQLPSRVVNVTLTDLTQVRAPLSWEGPRGEPGDGVHAPAAALDGTDESWLAFVRGATGQLSVVRRGTVLGGVAVTDGLPAVNGVAPLLAAGTSALALALPMSGGVQLFTLSRSPWRWNAQPSPQANVVAAGGAFPLVALAVDSADRPVLAWVGDDERVHVARLEGAAWVTQGTFSPSPGTLAFSVQVAVDAGGSLTVAWTEATHAPIASAAWPGPTTRSALRVARGGAAGWTERRLTPFDPAAGFLSVALALDDGGAAVLAYSEWGELFVVRAP